ncbi:MAG: hypothetical protein LUO97_01540 [Methanomicrobiales archaeon]|nr:hypothetical protein [Methanomicrobiales archaeon]
MNARFAIVGIFVLCGALLFIAGCTTAPSGGTAPTTVQVTSGPSSTSAADLGTIVALLRTLNDKVTLVEENTHPLAMGRVTGNLVLFDTLGNAANAIKTGKAVVALPPGSCDVAIYAGSVPLYITLEEEKDLSVQVTERYYRNRQACIDVPLCRRTVSLDENFAFLYIEYKPYRSQDSLDRVTLSYRC